MALPDRSQGQDRKGSDHVESARQDRRNRRSGASRRVDLAGLVVDQLGSTAAVVQTGDPGSDWDSANGEGHDELQHHLPCFRILNGQLKK